MEPEKGKKVDMAAALSEVNRYHLMFAGYSEAEIVGFGDLSKLTKDRMSELIRIRVVKEAGKGFDEAEAETELFRKRDEKKQQ
jgi:hypothetical protein